MLKAILRAASIESAFIFFWISEWELLAIS
jgi:hypothetical protein